MLHLIDNELSDLVNTTDYKCVVAMALGCFYFCPVLPLWDVWDVFVLLKCYVYTLR